MTIPTLLDLLKKGGIIAILFIGLKYMDSRIDALDEQVKDLEDALKDCQQNRIDDLKERMIMKSMNYTLINHLPILTAVLNKDEDDE